MIKIKNGTESQAGTGNQLESGQYSIVVGKGIASAVNSSDDQQGKKEVGIILNTCTKIINLKGLILLSMEV